MSKYTARVEVAGDMLHTSRPLTAPDEVTSLIDSVEYAVREDGSDLAVVELSVETSGDSGTPIGDSVTTSSSQPLPAAGGDA